MTITPPRAGADHRLVQGATGLLAEFNRAGVLDPVDVHTATTLARMLGEAGEEASLALALAVRGTRFGHVCIRPADVRETVAVEGADPATVDSLPWPDPDAWVEALATSPLVGSGEPTRPLVWEAGRLYLQRYHAYEQAVLGSLTARATEPAPDPGPATGLVDRLLPHSAGPAQRRAVEAGLTGGLTVVAGGPGTGKTFTVSRILATLLQAAVAGGRPVPSVALAAPTGKAAARMTDQVRESAAEMDLSPEAGAAILEVEASTLHRLLGWHPERGRFRHDRANPLPYDAVIVDEMSMVSLPMMARLLDAVRPGARLVLVGDPDQLVSIEAGTVLGDLVGPHASGDEGSGPLAGHVVVLDRVFRFGEESGIAGLADAVRRGDADRAIDLLRAGLTDLAWHDTADRPPDEDEAAVDEIAGHARELIRLGAAGNAEGALAARSRLAVLCAHRRGPAGVEHWNPLIEERAGRPGGRGRADAWYPGRPVMVTANDYRLGLFNGDLGVAVATVDGGVTVAFPDRAGIRLVGPGRLSDVETVHALTIHKSQGSQFDRVIAVLPDPESRLLTRELLYTAVTRARSHVTLVGGEEALRAAIGRQITRASGLGEGLWNLPVR